MFTPLNLPLISRQDVIASCFFIPGKSRDLSDQGKDKEYKEKRCLPAPVSLLVDDINLNLAGAAD